MNTKQNKILSIYIYIYLKSILFKILVFIYPFIRLLIVIGKYIFMLKTNLF